MALRRRGAGRPAKELDQDKIPAFLFNGMLIEGEAILNRSEPPKSKDQRSEDAGDGGTHSLREGTRSRATEKQRGF